MPVNLTKGQTVNLTKQTPTATLDAIIIGAGWDMAGGVDKVDLDLSLFAVKADGTSDEDGFIYFGYQKNAVETFVSFGDNCIGEGDGDDEIISAKLSALDPSIVKLVAVLTRYDNGGVALGKVENAFVRTVNQADGTELARFTVDGNEGAKSLTFGSFDRTPEGWTFTAIGSYADADLGGLCNSFGIKA